MIANVVRGLIVSPVCGMLLIWIGCTPNTVAQKRQDTTQIYSRVGAVPVGDGGPYKISFVDERDGWLAQGRNVWRTVDGGASWSSVLLAKRTSEQTSFAVTYGLGDLEFANSNIGVLQFGGEIYKTEDGGRNWTALSNLPLQEPKAFVRCFKFLTDGKRGWIGGGTYQPISVERAMVLPKEAISYRDRTYEINTTAIPCIGLCRFESRVACV